MSRHAHSASQENEVSILHPRHARHVYGHVEVERLLLQNWQTDTIPGAYLFTGVQGIGKASMAYRFAKFLIANGIFTQQEEQEANLFGDSLPSVATEVLDVASDHPVCMRIEAGSHPNFLVIEPGYDERKKTQRREILVDDTRKISPFLSMSAGEGHWRVILIDAADQMNRHAANAILKWLEEPPERALFVLISHQPEALLPTIRSRCRAFTFVPPGQEVFQDIVKMLVPAVEEQYLSDLYLLSDAAPGLAAEIYECNGLDFYYKMMKIMNNIPDFVLVTQYAERLAHLKWPIVQQLLSYMLGEFVKASSGAGEEKFQAIACRQTTHAWLDVWNISQRLMRDTELLYLDKKNVLRAILMAMAGDHSMLQAIH